ncbi:MAG: 2-C-methyl-D-erythritol 4-phosphate cytidylyltransferase [Bacteroidota bacterium]
MKENQYVILVAGGQGARMNSSVPKQFLLINNLPVIMYSMQAFYEYNPECKQILVLPEAHLDYWNELCLNHQIKINYILAKGGETRFHSVRNGLNKIEGKEGLVAVHDAVRMLVSRDMISNSFEHAQKYGTAIPYVKSKDSLRSFIDGKSSIVNRDEIIRMQTPQTFHVSILKEAYQQAYQTNFTDDANLVEKLGAKLHLFEGEESNIKITEPYDLLLAESILNSRDPSALPF